MKLIVADSSPLIMLAASGLLPALKAMTFDVIVPKTVFAECTAGSDKLGAAEILAARSGGNVMVRADLPDDEFEGELAGLDAGERAAITMARALSCPVLMDERLGRQAAHRQGVAVIGSIGILLEAKRQNALPAIAPVLEQWRAWGYFLSDALIRVAIAKAGEV